MAQLDSVAVADPATTRRLPAVRIGAVVAIAFAVAFVVSLVLSARQQAQQVAAAGPRIVSASDLQAESGPFWWAGEREGADIELEQQADGSVIVRYLPAPASAGDPQPALTVATYPRQDAYRLVRDGTARSGSVSQQYPSGALATSEGTEATNAYFAFPDSPWLVEVFDPQPGRAWDLISSGEIQAVP